MTPTIVVPVLRAVGYLDEEEPVRKLFLKRGRKGERESE
jgi:hypothetical protein